MTPQDPDDGKVPPAVKPRNAGDAMPRWVKVSGILLLLAVIAVIILLLSGHGPGQHTSPGHASAPGHATGDGTRTGAPAVVAGSMAER